MRFTQTTTRRVTDSTSQQSIRFRSNAPPSQTIVTTAPSGSPFVRQSRVTSSSGECAVREYAPGRSTTRNVSPPSRKIPSFFSTVFPLQFPVCCFSPVSRLKTVLLPTLGFPVRITEISKACHLPAYLHLFHLDRRSVPFPQHDHRSLEPICPRIPQRTDGNTGHHTPRRASERIQSLPKRCSRHPCDHRAPPRCQCRHRVLYRSCLFDFPFQCAHPPSMCFAYLQHMPHHAGGDCPTIGTQKNVEILYCVLHIAPRCDILMCRY